MDYSSKCETTIFHIQTEGTAPLPPALLLRGPERGESMKEPWKGGWIIVLQLYCTTPGPNFSSSTPSPLNFIRALSCIQYLTMKKVTKPWEAG